VIRKIITTLDRKVEGEADSRAEPAATGAEQSSLREGSLAVWREAPKRNDPPVSLPRRLRVEPVDQFFVR